MSHVKTGQSLVEVIITVGIVILVATGLVTGTTTAIRVNLNARARSVANKLVQEALENTRAERDKGWNLVERYVSQYHCLTGSGDFPLSSNCGSIVNCENTCIDFTAAGSGQIQFKRYIYFQDVSASSPPVTKIRVTATTIWKEGSTVRKSTSQTDLTDWRVPNN